MNATAPTAPVPPSWFRFASSVSAVAGDAAKAALALMLPILGAVIVAVLLRWGIWWFLAGLIWGVQQVAAAIDWVGHRCIAIMNFIGSQIAHLIHMRIGSIATDWQIPRPDPLPEKRDVFDLGIGAFGVAVILATLDKAIAPISTILTTWRNPPRNRLWVGFIPIFIAFLGLWFSVYGLKAIALSKDASPYVLGFDTRNWPLQQVDLRPGAVSFYVNFASDANANSFNIPVEAVRHTVTLSGDERSFLKQLANALDQCGSAEQTAKVVVHGFASSSYWSEAKGALDERLQAAGRSLPASCHITAGRPVGTWSPNGERSRERTDWNGMLEADRCLDQYRAASLRDPHRSGEPISYAQAFNLYLANRRQAEVAFALREEPHPHLSVMSMDWPDYDSMETALVIDDRGSGGAIATTGLLTRSVLVTITDAARCTKQSTVATEVTHLDIR